MVEESIFLDCGSSGGEFLHNLKEQTTANGKQPITHLAYRRRLIETLSEAQHSIRQARTGPRTSQTLERLQPVRHFM